MGICWGKEPPTLQWNQRYIEVCYIRVSLFYSIWVFASCVWLGLLVHRQWFRKQTQNYLVHFRWLGISSESEGEHHPFSFKIKILLLWKFQVLFRILHLSRLILHFVHMGHSCFGQIEFKKSWYCQ
jgi:hypothetical protein